jgi:hypothetical protein
MMCWQSMMLSCSSSPMGAIAEEYTHCAVVFHVTARATCSVVQLVAWQPLLRRCFAVQCCSLQCLECSVFLHIGGSNHEVEARCVMRSLNLIRSWEGTTHQQQQQQPDCSGGHVPRCVLWACIIDTGAHYGCWHAHLQASAAGVRVFARIAHLELPLSSVGLWGRVLHVSCMVLLNCYGDSSVFGTWPHVHGTVLQLPHMCASQRMRMPAGHMLWGPPCTVEPCTVAASSGLPEHNPAFCRP